jgi:ATP-binding cassette subfamily B protein
MAFSLDAPSEKAIYERYLEHARTLARRSGTITVIVSHRFSTVASADLVLVFAQGRLVEHGTHDELMAAAGAYHGLYSLQATAYSTERVPTGYPDSQRRMD